MTFSLISHVYLMSLGLTVASIVLNSSGSVFAKLPRYVGALMFCLQEAETAFP